MIESTLVQYGVLGLWTITLLGERIYDKGKWRKIMEKNTEVLLELKEEIIRGRN